MGCFGNKSRQLFELDRVAFGGLWRRHLRYLDGKTRRNFACRITLTGEGSAEATDCVGEHAGLGCARFLVEYAGRASH